MPLQLTSHNVKHLNKKGKMYIHILKIDQKIRV